MIVVATKKTSVEKSKSLKDERYDVHEFFLFIDRKLSSWRKRYRTEQSKCRRIGCECRERKVCKKMVNEKLGQCHLPPPLTNQHFPTASSVKMLGATTQLEGSATHRATKATTYEAAHGATKAASKRASAEKASSDSSSESSSEGSSVVIVVVRRPREVVDVHRKDVNNRLDVVDGDEVGLGDNGHRRDRNLGRNAAEVRSSGTCESAHVSTKAKAVHTATKTEILGSSRSELEEDQGGNRGDQESRLEDRRHSWCFGLLLVEW